MPTYLLVDDEDHCKEVLSSLLKDIDPLSEIIHSSSVDEGIVAYLKNKPDLVFLDVEMPTKDGFEFVHELIQLGESPKIVFVTAFNQYAIQAIKASALDYLLKPVNEDDLRCCLKRVETSLVEEEKQKKLVDLLQRMNTNSRLKISTRTGFELVKPNEILYCEADGNYTTIYLINKRKIITSINLGEIEKQLSHENFFRVARAVLINLDYFISLDRKERNCVLECEGRQYNLPISLKRVNELMEIF